MATQDTPRSSTLVHRLRHELIKYGLISAYLYVCFGALLLYKAVVLRGVGISYAPYGLAAIKALILAKFILLGHAARVGDRYSRRRLIHVILYKALLFLLLLVVLSVIEEVVVNVLHGGTVGASMTELEGSRLWQILSTSLIMLLILVPYIAFTELSVVLGEGRLRRLLFEHQGGSGNFHRSRPPPE
ncbi:MAG: hypothetical protein ABI224_02840 [Acetobacteraceae bacterium]